MPVPAITPLAKAHKDFADAFRTTFKHLRDESVCEEIIHNDSKYIEAMAIINDSASTIAMKDSATKEISDISYGYYRIEVMKDPTVMAAVEAMRNAVTVAK